MAQMFHSVSDRGKHQTNISQNNNFIYAECLCMLNVHNAECLLMFNAYIECFMFRNIIHDPTKYCLQVVITVHQQRTKPYPM